MVYGLWPGGSALANGWRQGPAPGRRPLLEGYSTLQANGWRQGPAPGRRPLLEGFCRQPASWFVETALNTPRQGGARSDRDPVTGRTCGLPPLAENNLHFTSLVVSVSPEHLGRVTLGVVESDDNIIAYTMEGRRKTMGTHRKVDWWSPRVRKQLRIKWNPSC